MNNLLISDAYKQSHIVQYPENTSLIYSNWTPRSDRLAKTKRGVVVFGIQAFLTKITEDFHKNFFSKDKKEVVKSFKEEYTRFFGTEPNTKHVEELWNYGCLPIKVKALPEGTMCPIGVPMLTIVNTQPKFYWFTNFLETIMSTELWLPMTSATIAKEYSKYLNIWAEANCDNKDHIPFQAHDFSMRGMSGLGAAKASGAGHLLSFLGTDTIPAVSYLEEYYYAKTSVPLIGTSIPATEHSVMSMGTRDDELGTFRNLITKTYPTGILSIVSDTWDLWKVITEYLPKLKDEILARDGKIVIRPDSGDPVKIICGDRELRKLNDTPRSKNGPAAFGVIELLWEIFGGTINSKGFKVLDPHIGTIYGDSITLERANSICEKLHAKGFAASNIVFGIGSYTYQYNTRDVYGFAMKATYGEIRTELPEGMFITEERAIYKDPITDNGEKKSLKGLLQVYKEEGTYKVKDNCTWEEENTGELKLIYKDGRFVYQTNLKKIRDNLKKY